jgi:hypothetical protein
MLQRSSGFLPPVHVTCHVGFGVFSVKPGCHSSGSIRNLLVYLPPAHRVKKTRYSVLVSFEKRVAVAVLVTIQPSSRSLTGFQLSSQSVKFRSGFSY